ncbi:Chaperone DnaJ-domain superfamily protein [Perilla frutescens var. hirtella]|uniref:Chaperone DnaJ-domain superfamily protein n=1 Tax=Perilla frutescens var. hirtella TaxID=608512 RepID=A0AAD4JCW7_PERFH|nr:Chaperone DnaJ-domain superfamily protein [Perilla frutescens var. frutescens]KAH6800781.1 Chaperone DnaJ-domain superfamily protein [Perilla frutescens var. hirtella]KAH6831509.1 Chaperone DnaJ-domain superfamily protein [Perilla frutescens var. hirtella]
MAAAAAVGCGSASGSWAQLKDSSSNYNKGFRVSCVSSVVTDPYKTLKIQPTASESEVKKAFRKLALKYHPDVCRGSNCGVQFHQINEAYDIVMSNLREEPEMLEHFECYDDEDEPMRGMNDQDWEHWEEWMGWEGAGIRDYSSHINPYI